MGNNATTKHRTVTVVDETCPTITMLGRSLMYVEAGYTWVDPGATAEDDLDGDITDHIITDGDTVNYAKAFYSRRSCREIKETYPEANTGLYYISRYIDTQQTWKRILVHFDMDNDATPSGDGNGVGVTYFPCDGCKAVQPYASAQGDCEAFGLKMINWDWEGYRQGANNTESVLNFNMKGYLYYFIPQNSLPVELRPESRYISSGYTDMYLCGINDADANDAAQRDAWKEHVNNAELEKLYGENFEKVRHAESGKYVISYKVSDSSNNPQCESPSRTVIVRDTLPPVLTLHVYNKNTAKQELIQTSSYTHHGIVASGDYTHMLPPHAAPPVAPRESNTLFQDQGLDASEDAVQATFNGKTNGHYDLSFMAERTTSANAWLVGAVASAVAGMALLAVGSRKKAVVSVPV